MKERPDYCMFSVLVKVVLIILYLKCIFSRWSGIASEKLIFGACLMSNFWPPTITISKEFASFKIFKSFEKQKQVEIQLFVELSCKCRKIGK